MTKYELKDVILRNLTKLAGTVECESYENSLEALDELVDMIVDLREIEVLEIENEVQSNEIADLNGAIDELEEELERMTDEYNHSYALVNELAAKYAHSFI
jgi:predicted  nucleic acid-binding Zn-ribbon protein